MLPTPLAPLAAYPQFVAWRIEMRPNSAGVPVPAKIPYSPVRPGGASSTDPASWGTYDQAQTFATRNNMAGVGFVFSAADPFFFLDIDGAWNGTEWSQLAQELLARLPGAAVEVSQSGTGLHIIGRTAALGEHANKNTGLHLEIYTQERFVALTGTYATGSVDTDCSGPLAAIAQQYFTRTHTASSEWTTEPVPEWKGPEDDGELLARIFAAGSRSAGGVFGGDGPEFAGLWAADSDLLARKWPGNNGSYDASSADQALANQLAFWTGKNCERIERLMRSSGLVRSKWDDHATYLQNTILKACGFVRNVYQERSPNQPAQAVPGAPSVALDAAEIEAAGYQPRGGGMLMFAQEQMTFFAECIYVTNLDKILVPSGDLLNQSRFDVVYGGHTFTLTADNSKVTTSAWEAFLKNGGYRAPIADRICFRPERGAGGIVIDGGKSLANTYQPAHTEETEGDADKFLNHMRKMLPHGDDFEILISWMASVKQNPGMKAQWWPVVQGAEGNFKSFLLEIMSFAVGHHYAHLPNMEKMVRGGMNFNGWLERKLFLGLDEVYAADRRGFFEGFKTTVTNRRLAMEGKGLEETTGDNRANGMAVTNHQDGVPISGKNRRWAAFFCAQQTPEDMLRDGMDAAYISDLKDWFLGEGIYHNYGPNYGLRIMNHFLARMPIKAERDPARMSIRCPVTTSTAQAIVSGRGNAEQEIMEAVEEEQPGFAGGWVSSLKLNDLIERKKLRVPVNKRLEMMQSLGYDYHPALVHVSAPGRVVSIVAPDNGKPRLYIRKDHIMLSLTNPPDVGRAYSEAQLKAAGENSKAGQVFK